jgi:uncharacterized membrane protein
MTAPGTLVGVWVSVGVMLVGSIIVAEVGRRAASGTLPRNDIAGIRLPSTMRDDESWHIAHLAGGPAMAVAGVLAAGLSIGAGVIGVLFGAGPGTAVVLVAALVLLAGVLLSGWLGVSAVRERRP